MTTSIPDPVIIGDGKLVAPDWRFGGLERNHYGVILADPPWKFRTWSGRGNGRACPYDTMSLEDIAALPVRDLAASDCFLAMWTTAPFLRESLGVMEAWGFSYSTAGAWSKENESGGLSRGTGYYWRSSAEFWIAGTRGSPGRARGMSIPNCIRAKRREHSRKPDRLHEDLERMWPVAARCELFARQRRPGWDVWGNQTDKFTDAAMAHADLESGYAARNAAERAKAEGQDPRAAVMEVLDAYVPGGGA